MEASAERQRMAERRLRRDSKNAEKSGETLLDLVIHDHEPALGGRVRITFVKRNRELNLPWTRLRVGSPVVISATGSKEEPMPGVVSRKKQSSIEVTTNRRPEAGSADTFRLDISTDQITRTRMQAAMDMARVSRGRLGKMRELLMGERAPEFGEPPKIDFAEGQGSTLNESQQEAVSFALSARDLAIIHGPPGTGKTTTVVEFIIQAVKRGDKVLACAPSNTAVDNLLSKLHDRKQRVVRLGHPARVAAHLQSVTMDGLVAKHENMRVIKDMLREADSLFREIDRYSRAAPPPGARRAMRDDAKRLKRDARLMEKQAVEHILDRADIICATTTFDASVLGDRWYDLTAVSYTHLTLPTNREV